jgi:spore coat polysaccharide biosynthesis protein SpsF
MSVCGKPLLWHLIKRLKQSREINEIVVATTVESKDDPISLFCQLEGFVCFRGSEEDVLDRFYKACSLYKPDYVVRITADCPLIDPGVVDKVILLCRENEADYASNTNPPTFPDGLDAEVFTFPALERSWREAEHKYQMEHVTSFITENPEMFKIVNYSYIEDLSSWRLTLDEPEDFQVIKKVYEALYSPEKLFDLHDIVSYLKKNPGLLKINSEFLRNENYNTDNK